jgi:N-sulfoglucosamine sulfohydrolase
MNTLNMINIFRITAVSMASSFLQILYAQDNKPEDAKCKPNVLFVISDDQSYPFASAYGNNTCRTPNFDRIAKMGVLFTNAFVTSPGCAPSRASILTGRMPWANEQAGTHASLFPLKYKTFPVILQENGYHIGFTCKGWGPGEFIEAGWPHNPAGIEYSDRTLRPPYKGINQNNYSANFDDFIAARQEGQPFFFWFGAKEPHRSYEKDSYKKEGRQLSEAFVPSFLPDNDIVRGDILDYATEVEWYDRHLGKILDKLESMGELNNTLIIVTADNGMPFPMAKANCYDQGIHVPLAICWKNVIPGNRVSNDLVSMVDIAATILDATGTRFTGTMEMTGKSMMKLLKTGKQGITDTTYQAVFACRERHSSSRYNNMGYPMRMVRTSKFLYVRNLHPERWPAGDPQEYVASGVLGPMHGAYHDIDDGATIDMYRGNFDDPDIKLYFISATAKRGYEELFDIESDPGCMNNLAENESFSKVLGKMRLLLDKELVRTGDSRVTGSDPEIWETYKRYSEIRIFPEN